MAFVNIRRDVDDKFYRYRMPLLQIKVEGKGNGIKTVVPNMSDIAKALSRPPSYPTKFFGFELGAQTTLDDKNDRYIINGSHSADRLRELLDSFIEKFVLCQSCKNPETDLKITKADGMILRDCKACGKRSNVDMRHKLTTFITKNPPPKKSKKGQGVDASEAENNGINGSENTSNGKSNGNDDADAGSDDELTKKIQEEAKDIPTAEQRNNDDEDWSVDTSEAAVAARIQALEGGLKGSLTLNDDENEDGEDEDSPYSLFGKWCKESKSGGENGTNDGQGPTPAEVYKKAQEFGIEKKHKTLLVLMQNLFTENVVKEIERFAPVLSKMNTSEKHQKSLLGGVERLCGVEIPTLIPTGVPKILMALYQIDVLDEEMIKTWSTHVSKKYVDKETCKKVRKASVPFVEWLDQAESSDEEDEDEDLDNL